MKRIQFANGEHYHVFNRGNDGRIVFMDEWDAMRFLQSIEEFNTIIPIGSIYENSFKKKKLKLGNPIPKLIPLVNIICYCLNPNHYHFILEQLVDRGIEKFMHRIGIGYTNFFNKKYKRNGSLFQGGYKAILIDSNEYLLHLSAYVNLNDKVHQLGNRIPKSSWAEYTQPHGGGFCKKGIILDQFNSRDEYKKFAEDSLVDMVERKQMEKLLLE